MNRIIYISLFFCLTSLFVWAADTNYTTVSKLNEGKWVKIELEETGICKLTYDDLKKMGFSSPEKVGVYGYGGWPLYEDFTKAWHDDLPAVPLWRGNNYILFYGRGVRRWQYSNSTKTFEHTNNPYSTKGYYFLSDVADPVEMTTDPGKENNTGQVIETYDDYYVHEQDLVSVNQSGRELFGESLRGTTRTINFSFPGITDEDAKVTMRVIARAQKETGKATLVINGNRTLSLKIDTDSDTYTKAVAKKDTIIWKGEKTETIKTELSYDRPNHENSHLDYIRMQVKRLLQPYGAYTLFRSLKSVDMDSRFIIRGANANTLVFDVTDPAGVKLMQTTLNGSELSFAIEGGELREFALVQTDKSGFITPQKTGDIANQNLHELQDIDMIVITLPFLREQAQRLADAHTERGLTVEVVTAQSIYNEFSSGTPDASAYRRLMKMLYDQATSEEKKPKYLLLFGDGIYDNRGIVAEVKNAFPPEEIHNRLLLTYQSENSIDIDSYVTDDYFGFLKDGLTVYSSIDYTLPSWKLDIGIGRLPVRTQSEAYYAVEKIINYMNNKETGIWKNNIAFVADDGNTSDKFTNRHLDQSETIAKYMETNHSEYQLNKLYFDAYKKDKSSSPATYPEVRKRLLNLFKTGLLAVNYIGHGDTQAWSDEKILIESDITTASHKHLPLWITATCDFTRFDAPATSAGEQVFLNRTSGGIGLYTTTRVVISQKNGPLNESLFQYLFKKENNQRLSLGEIMKLTKNQHRDSNRLNFILIGDPAMKLAYPDLTMRVTTINGKPVGDEPETLRAYDQVTIEGEIVDHEGSIASDFNGTANYTFFDSKVTKETLHNNESDTPTVKFNEYANMLHTGNSQIANGRFNFSFQLTDKISYSNDFGKMNLYASDATSGVEANGDFSHFKLGGTNPNKPEDNEGPEIRAIYLNDSTFVNGDKVNPTPLFVANVWDQSGINVSSSTVGQDIILIIDGNSSQSYSLNNYFENLSDREGEIRVVFPIPELAAGEHTAEFMIWDIHSNSTRDTLTFIVEEGIKPDLIKVNATPNPARERVEFSLDHNRPETLMTVTLHVYDATGRLRWQHQESGSSELFKSYIVSWDMIDNTGARLRPGVYIYKAAIQTNYSKEATKGNKLIVFGQ
ncbi:type IX secretion system sortase PorU [Parabacteroides sp. OttesenSCG-928-G06]|nr:type IX secretion system sortase PorU [Parabacteroides sp. OttesenSCG-928-K15]MDL2282026.1 type IX secretion system sortase PorU [Parabacteroides sp. OttesenSCG-928-G06]